MRTKEFILCGLRGCFYGGLEIPAEAGISLRQAWFPYKRKMKFNRKR
jgi:hypothetical protein